VRRGRVSTALSWTELLSSRRDLAALLQFRRSGLNPAARRRLRIGGLALALFTVAAAVGPAYLGGPQPRDQSGAILAVFPSLCLGFLVLACISAIASAGGREVIPREQAVAFPISSMTDHLGALLLAPLNIAWMVQTWALVGAAAYTFGPTHLAAYELPVLLWVVSATALAQVAGWCAEGVRRGRNGILTFRIFVVVLAGAAVALVVTDRMSALLDRSPTRLIIDVLIGGRLGHWTTWLVGIGCLAVAGLAAIVVGVLPAAWALGRPMREELRLESGHHRARRLPGSDLAMMLRIDRTAIWRSVPLRRGLTVLALMPGAVALAGHLEWRMLSVLPGLVASGAALLFGVNTWCLDGRGALWRDSLPVPAWVAFASRVIVLYEVLLASAAVTLLMAALRAGRPSTAEVVALLCSTLVVASQVVSASMRWSIARPFAADLRSARATPAPPVVMAGYSARLAMVTTFTGLIYSGLAELGDIRIAVSITVVLLSVSLLRLVRAGGRWNDPVTRSRVVAVVAG
jgi:hypothetical protein